MSKKLWISLPWNVPFNDETLADGSVIRHHHTIKPKDIMVTVETPTRIIRCRKSQLPRFEWSPEEKRVIKYGTEHMAGDGEMSGFETRQKMMADALTAGAGSFSGRAASTLALMTKENGSRLGEAGTTEK
jgi:hypothetical protein